MRKISALLCVSVLLTVLTPTTPVQAVAPNCDRFRSMALEVGWKKRDMVQLLKICTRESKGFERAWNKKDPWTGSYGIMQINGSWKGYLIRQGFIKRSMTELWRPRLALRVSLHIFGLYGWRPWAGSSA